jgi:hypothetical protein
VILPNAAACGNIAGEGIVAFMTERFEAMTRSATLFCRAS